MQTDRLPPPDGLSHGFTLHDTNFLPGPSVAQIRPQNGLITAIMSETGRGFPVEEYVHLGTALRNPELITTTQFEYWHRQPDAEIQAITAWSPFVEAINHVSRVFDAHRPLDDNATGTVQSPNEAYADWYADQALAWYRRNQTDEGEPPSDRSWAIFPPSKGHVADLTQQLIRFIAEYKIHGLHHQDIHDRWLGPDTDFLILALIELVLPRLVSARASLLYDQYISYYPQQCWQAIEETLTVWRTQVACGESPFPFQNATARAVYDFLEGPWARLTTSTLGLLCEAVLSRSQQANLITSLPALYYNLDPHTATQWFASPRYIHRYPVLMLLQERPECTILETSPDRQAWYTHAEVIWDLCNQCHLYTDLAAWQLTTQDTMTYTHKNFRAMAVQLWTFLTKVERLWHTYNDSIDQLDCTHCRTVLSLIPAVPNLQEALEHWLFTNCGPEPLLDAARQYIPWIEQAVTQTSRENPFLTHQEAVYPPHPFPEAR